MNLPNWCNIEARRLKPNKHLFNKGFSHLTIGENFWLNYLFHYIILHCQIPTSSIIPYLSTSIPINYSGYILADGTTIGSSSSLADHASDDYENLFKILWRANAPVVGGRGVDENSDWSANKELDLPDLKESILVGQKDSGIFADLYSTVGSNNVTLTVNQIPPHTHSIELPYKDLGYDPSGGYDFYGPTDDTATINTSSIGGGQAHNNIMSSFVLNFFIKY